jgi:uncharacterized membrane protein YdjX (TVP38/TMEM64 family)
LPENTPGVRTEPPPSAVDPPRRARATNHTRVRRALLAIWFAVLAGAIYLFLFKRELVQLELHKATSFSLIAGSAVYLFFACIRGFTLIPATTLIVAALPFFPPAPLFLLTLTGVVISSASVYVFAEALNLEELIARKHQRQFDRLKAALQQYELPVIIGWSFFPLAPTDMICYACGVLEVDFRKCVLGVAIGEGIICAIYIFLGDHALRAIGLKL